MSEGMSDFYNAEYLSERLAAVCKERDELRKIVEKQLRMNRSAVALALELDRVKAERDALLSRFGGLMELQDGGK